MINKCLVFLILAFMALPAFAAQHVAVHPRPPFPAGEQDAIREIVDLERQSKRSQPDVTPNSPSAPLPTTMSRLLPSAR